MPMSARLPALVATLLLAALPVAARCPQTAADAAVGIVVAYDDGSTTRLVLDPQGPSRAETSYNDGSNLGELVIGRHGYLTTQIWAMEDGLMVTAATMLRDFPADVLTDAPLAAGETQEIAVTSRFAETTFDDRLTLTAGPDTTVTIGGCTLQAREVAVTLATMDPPEVETFLYLPELEVSVLMTITGGTAPELVMTPVSIEVAD